MYADISYYYLYLQNFHIKGDLPSVTAVFVVWYTECPEEVFETVLLDDWVPFLPNTVENV